MGERSSLLTLAVTLTAREGDIDKEIGIDVVQILTRSRFPNSFVMFVILMLINWNFAIILDISGAHRDTPLLKQLEKRAKKKYISKSGADYKSRAFQRPQMKMSRRKPNAKDMLVLDNQKVELLLTER